MNIEVGVNTVIMTTIGLLPVPLVLQHRDTTLAHFTQINHGATMHGHRLTVVSGTDKVSPGSNHVHGLDLRLTSASAERGMAQIGAVDDGVWSWLIAHFPDAAELDPTHKFFAPVGQRFRAWTDGCELGGGVAIGEGPIPFEHGAGIVWGDTAIVCHPKGIILKHGDTVVSLSELMEMVAKFTKPVANMGAVYARSTDEARMVHLDQPDPQFPIADSVSIGKEVVS